jgi:hypothetical protein
MDPERELTEERLGSREEYETSDIKIYKLSLSKKMQKHFSACQLIDLIALIF